MGSESDQEDQAGGGPGARAGQAKLEPGTENGLSGLANANTEEQGLHPKLPQDRSVLLYNARD